MIMRSEADLDAIQKEGKEKAALNMLKAMESSYGEIPKESAALDERTTELISIAVSSAIRCMHSLKLHVRAASRLGIEDNQVVAAVFLAGNLSNASVLATAARNLNDEREICPICEMGSKACEIQSAVKN